MYEFVFFIYLLSDCGPDYNTGPVMHFPRFGNSNFGQQLPRALRVHGRSGCPSDAAPDAEGGQRRLGLRFRLMVSTN